MAVPNRTGSVKNLAPPPVKMPERKDLDDTGTAPMSPTSPWGLNAVQKKQFEWPAALGNFTFDTTDAACEPFGLFHNDRVLFTKGQWNGQKAIVLGVTNGVLWVQLDEEEYAKDLKGCHNAEDTKTKYGAVLLEEEVVEQAFPVSPQHPKMEFVGARDEQELKAFQYSGPMGLYTFNCTREATEPFSFYHGQRIRATRGAYRSRCATVIGVLNGALWIHLDGDKGASPCHFCSNKDDLEAKYGWKVLNPISPRPAGHLADSPHIPANKIEYRGPFGMTYLYERSDEALKPYGLRHGQLVKLNRGISSGKKAVVIGVQAGSLWLHVEGDRAATACTFCSSFEDLEERYKITLLPDLPISVDASKPPFPNVPTDGERRQMSKEAIENVSLKYEPWGEAVQPQTYRYLRAYARWRLPKSTPPGQAFMLYYVKDTAQRTAEALDNLQILRKYWAMQRNRGEAGYSKPLALATEKEMMHCLSQIPLSAINILSAT